MHALNEQAFLQGKVTMIIMVLVLSGAGVSTWSWTENSTDACKSVQCKGVRSSSLGTLDPR